MKKTIVLILSVVLITVMMCSCGKEEKAAKESVPKEATNTVEYVLPDIFPMDLCFTSGVGAWASGIKLNRDGTFKGDYHDSDMGDIGDDNPNGTVHVSSFKGTFTNIEKVDDYTYTLKLKSVKTEKKIGTEWIEEGTKFIAEDAMGIDDGKNFTLYMKDCPKSKVPEEMFRNVCFARAKDPDSIEKLPNYVLYNEKGKAYFYNIEK